jgi:hypothetical protein
MRGYDGYELSTPAAERAKRLRKQRSLRAQALARIFGLIMGGPLPMPALPQERPAVVAEDPRRRGGQGGRESEAELASVRAHYPEARLMEQLGRLATRTVDDAEAEALIGALVPLAGRVVPQAESALLRATPALVGGLSNAVRVLREHPATTPLVRCLPTVTRRTALDLGRRASHGRPIPPQAARHALARQTMRVLGTACDHQAEGLLERESPRGGRATRTLPRLTNKQLRFAIKQAAKRAATTPFRSPKGCNDLCVSLLEVLRNRRGVRIGLYPLAKDAQGRFKLPTKPGVAPPEGWDAHIVVQLGSGRVVDPLRGKIYPSLHALRADIFTAPVRTQVER